MIAKASKFTVEEWELDKVRATLFENNPRLISEKVLEDLQRAITKHGFILPVVINQRTNQMVGGHQRFKAAERLKLNTVPVRVVDLDEQQELALNLALNKIEGKWDYALLEEALTRVSEADMLMYSGFSETDLVEILSGQDDFEETFEEFAGRFAGRSTRDFVVFRSPSVTFTCAKSIYEAFVHSLYKEVGVDDIKAGDTFFKKIGLEVD